MKLTLFSTDLWLFTFGIWKWSIKWLLLHAPENSGTSKSLTVMQVIQSNITSRQTHFGHYQGSLDNIFSYELHFGSKISFTGRAASWQKSAIFKATQLTNFYLDGNIGFILAKLVSSSCNFFQNLKNIFIIKTSLCLGIYFFCPYILEKILFCLYQAKHVWHIRESEANVLISFD